MTYQVKVVAPKPDNLSFVPGHPHRRALFLKETVSLYPSSLELLKCLSQGRAFASCSPIGAGIWTESHRHHLSLH